MNILESFEKHCMEHGSRECLSDGTDSLCYADVWKLSGRVYAYIKNRGIGREQTVLVSMDRNVRALVCVVGILRSGAAFLVMGQGYPEERMDYIRKDTECALEITEDLFQEILAAGEADGYEDRKPHDLAYMLHTSGTTGNPKCVMHEFGGIGKFRNVSMLEGNNFDRIATMSPMNSAGCIYWMLYSIYNGRTFVLVPDEATDNAGAFRKFLEDRHVTAAVLTPSFYKAVGGLPSSLGAAVLIGEAVRDIYCEEISLYNGYSQSELGSLGAVFLLDRAYDATPAGRFVDGTTEFRLLDEEGESVPEGEAGELCVENPYFRGYRNLPEQTAEAMRGGIYHTGDLFRVSEDGNLLYVNRKDYMVKINGCRVEPGETESVLLGMEGIRDAAVRAFENASQRTYLCAYYIPEPEADPGEEEIYEYLRARLPEYMVPAFLVRMEEFPLNQNGKLDRLALKAPDAAMLQEAYTAPIGPLETEICNAFAEVLRLNRVGRTDDFFRLGGDSVSAIAAAGILERVGVSSRLIYTGRTAEKIAGMLESDGFSEPTEEEIRKSGQITPRIIPCQRFYIDYQLYAPKGSGPNVPSCFKLYDPGMPPERIAEALLQVFRHFSAFGSVFEFAEDGELCLVRRPELVRPVEILHLSEEEALKAFALDVRKPVPVVKELPYRCKLCAVSDRLYILYFVFQHAVMDGASIINMLQALDDVLAGKELWPDAYYCYLDRTGKTCLSQKETFVKLAEKYGDSSFDRIPRFDHVSKSREVGTGYFPVPVHFSQFKKKAEEAGLSVGLLFSAAGLMALKEYNRTDRVRINWIYSARDEKWVRDIVGLTMTALPVAVDFGLVRDVKELLDEIRRQNSENIPYAGLSAGLADHSPGLTDALTMIYDGELSYPGRLFENASEVYLFDQCTSMTMLMECVFLTDSASGEISIAINWSRGMYEDESVQRFAGILISRLAELYGSL